MKKLLLLLTLSTFVVAQHVGTLSSIRGDVTITRSGSSFLAHQNDTLQKGDTLHTAKRARAQIYFNDETVVTLGQKSHFIINDYITKSKSDANVKLSMPQGTFRIITGKIGKIAPKKFKMRVKNSTIGIRGTDFAGVTNERSTGVLYIGKGKGVDIFDARGNRLLNEPGDGVFVENGEPMPHKAKWSQEEIDLIFTGLGEKEPKAFNYLDNFQLSVDQRNMFHNRGSTDVNVQPISSGTFNMLWPLGSGFSADLELSYLMFWSKGLVQGHAGVLGKAFLAYDTTNRHYKLGQFSLHTPLTGTKPFHVTTGAWRGNDTSDWYWVDDTAFVGASHESVLDDGALIINTALVSHIRPAEDIARTLATKQLFGTNITSPLLAVLGVTHTLDNLSYQLYDYALQDGNFFYADADTAFTFTNDLLRLRSQYLVQTTNTKQAHLIGAAISYESALSAVMVATTFQRGDGSIDSIMQGNPAYTNSFFNHDYFGAYGSKIFNGPYAQNVDAYRVAAQHIFRFLPSVRFEVGHAWYQQTLLMQESNVGFSGQFSLLGQSLKVGAKYGYIQNANFQTGDAHQYMIITNWHF